MKKLLFVFLLCPLFVTGCHAEGLYAQAGDLSQAARVESALPGPGRAISGELKLDGSYDTQGALERLWQYVIAQGREQLMSEVNNTACLVVIALLTAILLPFCGNKQIEGIVERAGCCAAALLLTGRFGSLLDEAGETLASLADYSHVILQVLFTSAAAGGAVVSASVRYASACLGMDVMISVSQRFLMPLVYMFLALSICQSLYENSV